jgi:signal transduction histidine kinase
MRHGGVEENTLPPPPQDEVAPEPEPLVPPDEDDEVAEADALEETTEVLTEAPVEPSVAEEVESEGEHENEISGAAPAAIEHDDAYSTELHNWQDADPETVYASPSEPLRFHDDPEAADEDDGVEEPVAEASEPETAEEERPLFRSLSALVDRLAADEDLYTPLNEADDTAPQAPEPPEPAEPEEPVDEGAPTLFKITGRGFRANVAPEASAPVESDALFAAGIPDIEAPEVAHDLVERVSRYNFDELSRILNDRVGLGERSGPSTAVAGVPAKNAAPEQGNGALVNLGGETLVLNRLPLGILVFRDQQILFANRAITEMVGYESVESLRQAGLTAVFPVSAEENGAGPVNHLMQRDGTLVPVTARLQSTSWQGRPALMLSASTTEVRTGHEDAVRAFAQAFAELRGDGFIELSRTGVVRHADALATTALGEGSIILGKPLSALIGADEGFALRGFLDRPGRFAETERPSIVLQSLNSKSEIVLFAQGQAGIVSGYFAFVRQRIITPRRAISGPEADPALLARISRGVRRPLNTIIGFAELLRSKAFGDLGDERYETYAEDLAAAGSDIADELEDYARLREGKYLPERASLDLTELLETCVLRIRNQANTGRIIVRNAISETLPRVTVDRASLAQAVLNLLASAIDQSPIGSTVVISAQLLDDGGIAIHVRDSSNHAVDMAERFVVFRDGVSKTGQALAPVRSSVGLALTRSLLAVNTVSLSVDPAGESGLLFTLRIPADLVENLPDA